MDIIVGGGKYGCHAVRFERKKGRSFAVVDTDPNCLAVKEFKLKTSVALKPEGEYFIQGSLPKALELIEALNPEYVFPTAPIHVAAELAKTKFKLTPYSEAIDTILPRIPEVVILFAGRGTLVVSYNRDNECLEQCIMPETCPTSYVKKPCSMTKLMTFASPQAFILVSHAMAPGMGALKGKELQEFFDWAQNKSKFIVGTSCDCHGIFSALQKTL